MTPASAPTATGQQMKMLWGETFRRTGSRTIQVYGIELKVISDSLVDVNAAQNSCCFSLVPNHHPEGTKEMPHQVRRQQEFPRDFTAMQTQVDIPTASDEFTKGKVCRRLPRTRTPPSGQAVAITMQVHRFLYRYSPFFEVNLELGTNTFGIEEVYERQFIKRERKWQGRKQRTAFSAFLLQTCLVVTRHPRKY
jgi:hypothetical protein